jgi:hypothetical protein
MLILHAFWLPDATADFVQTGSFGLWAETLETRNTGSGGDPAAHPFHLARADWPALLEGRSPGAAEARCKRIRHAVKPFVVGSWRRPTAPNGGTS